MKVWEAVTREEEPNNPNSYAHKSVRSSLTLIVDIWGSVVSKAELCESLFEDEEGEEREKFEGEITRMRRGGFKRDDKEIPENEKEEEEKEAIKEEFKREWREKRSEVRMMKREKRATLKQIKENARKVDEKKWKRRKRQRLSKKQLRHNNFSWMEKEQADMNQLMKSKLSRGGGGKKSSRPIIN